MASPKVNYARVHILYALTLLTVEPLTAFAGFAAATLSPASYLQMTHATSAPTADSVPLSTYIAVQQLANLYLLFALNEALVLRASSVQLPPPKPPSARTRKQMQDSTSTGSAWLAGFVPVRIAVDLRVWRTLLFGLLVADFGHLWAVSALGHEVFWKFWEWNAMAFGNVGIVYAGATMRICFLLGVGVG